MPCPSGLLIEADIDQALEGVFRVMIRLGLLDPPDRPTPRSARAPSPGPATTPRVRPPRVTGVGGAAEEQRLLPLDRTGCDRSP